MRHARRAREQERERRDNSLAALAPNTPRVRCPAAALPDPAALVVPVDVPASASALALAARHAPVVSARHDQAALVAAQVVPLRLLESHRAHNVPVRPRAVAGASNIPRPRKAR